MHQKLFVVKKYIALLIDALNHDASISEYLNPANRIQKILNKYKDNN